MGTSASLDALDDLHDPERDLHGPAGPIDVSNLAPGPINRTKRKPGWARTAAELAAANGERPWLHRREDDRCAGSPGMVWLDGGVNALAVGRLTVPSKPPQTTPVLRAGQQVVTSAGIRGRIVALSDHLPRRIYAGDVCVPASMVALESGGMQWVPNRDLRAGGE
jgi:hypothetical protein